MALPKKSTEQPIQLDYKSTCPTYTFLAMDDSKPTSGCDAEMTLLYRSVGYVEGCLILGDTGPEYRILVGPTPVSPIILVLKDGLQTPCRVDSDGNLLPNSKKDLETPSNQAKKLTL